MNIRIVNPLGDHLISAKFLFGSRIYGNHTEQSDHDYLHLVNYDCGEKVLQYKDAQYDYLYTDMKNFLKHLSTGASQVNFEVLHTDDFQNKIPIDPMQYYTSRTAKAYLGLAKRDLYYPERLFHVNRCLYIAEKVIKKELIQISDIGKLVVSEDLGHMRQQIAELRAGLKYDNE